MKITTSFCLKKGRASLGDAPKCHKRTKARAPLGSKRTKVRTPLVAIFACSGLLGGLLLAACADLTPTPPATITPIPATDTPTVTVVWFPPTRTRPQFPTQAMAPTQEYHPGIGPLIFSDSFNQPDLWDTAASDVANALVTRNRLVLSYSGQAPLSVASLRKEPLLGDFYAEATADVSLCGSKDQYGLVFRAAPGSNYYRFAVNCNGEVRLERSVNGQVYPIQDWVSSGDATFGAPAHLTLAVWVVGDEIRAFLNDSFQFSVRDPVFRTGSLGFFVSAAGNSAITASFSDLLVYSVSYTPPAPSATPTRTPKP